MCCKDLKVGSKLTEEGRGGEFVFGGGRRTVNVHKVKMGLASSDCKVEVFKDE